MYDSLVEMNGLISRPTYLSKSFAESMELIIYLTIYLIQLLTLYGA